jgi:hypothetical protein
VGISILFTRLRLLFGGTLRGLFCGERLRKITRTTKRELQIIEPSPRRNRRDDAVSILVAI